MTPTTTTTAQEPFDVSQYNLNTPEGLLQAQMDLGQRQIVTEFDQVARDAANTLTDIFRFAQRTIDYTQQSSENTIKALEQTAQSQQRQLENEKAKLQTLAEQRVSDIQGERDATKEEFTAATIRAGGGRFSTLATGQASIDTKYAELQQRVKTEVQQQLVDLGLKQNESADYYAAKITDVRLNSEYQLSNLLDTQMTKVRDITLGLSDNQAKMNTELNKLKLDYQKNILAVQAEKEKAERDTLKELSSFNMEFEKLLNSTPKGNTVTIMMPNGQLVTGTGRERIVGSGGSKSAKPSQWAYIIVTGKQIGRAHV